MQLLPDTLPFVSVVIPCRNEENFIHTVVTDILRQKYPTGKLEILVVDGNSTDQTIAVIEQLSSVNSHIKLIENKNQYVPNALNLGIRHSKGEIVVILGAHASYPDDYIPKMVAALLKLNADNVGGIGITKPSKLTLAGIALAEILSHRFGVGNSHFRVGISHILQSDTIPFGCYRKSVFEHYGYFDERLIRNQDIEFNKRICALGAKMYLIPEVHFTYYARSNYSSFIKNNFNNGVWVILTTYLTGTIYRLSLRHFIPLFFVLYLVFALSLYQSLPLLLLPFLLYLVLNLYFSTLIAIKKCNPLLIPFLLLGFILLHLSYGIGCMIGIIKIPGLKL